MSQSPVHKDVTVTADKAKVFYHSQETLLKKAIKNIDVLDRQIKRARIKIKSFHAMVKKYIKQKKENEEDNILKMNMNIIKISLKAKKEQASLKRLNILRQGISEKMGELAKELEALKKVAEQRGIVF